jgi:hypothetical protein
MMAVIAPFILGALSYTESFRKKLGQGRPG